VSDNNLICLVSRLYNVLKTKNPILLLEPGDLL